MSLIRWAAVPAAAALLAFAPGVALAEKPCPPGQAKKGNCAAFEQAAPGRAAKPEARPAHAGKPRDGAARPASVDDSLPFVRLLNDPALFSLPVLTDGSRYALVGDRIVRIDDADTVLGEVRRLDARADCPSGLATKEPACIPPGQARKVLGATAQGDAWRIVDDYGRYGVTAPDGAWDYYTWNDEMLVRVDRDTRAVLSIVRALTGA